MNPYFDIDGNPITVAEWGILHLDQSYTRIGRQEFEGNIYVSTVWLGINHQWRDGPPIIFETMIFSKNDLYPYGDEQMRYSTKAEAEKGHQRTCEDIEHGRRPWFLGED